MNLRIAAVCLALLTPVWAAADPEGILIVRITPQVLEQDRSISWEQPLVKETRAGVPVVVNINADPLMIRVSVTPFVRGGDFLLVVQGDIRQKSATGIRRSTSLQSLLVPSGESIAYFPLGREPGATGRQMLVMIRVEPLSE